MYYEDRDLSRRYRDSGLPVRPTEGLVADHTKVRPGDGGDLQARVAAYTIMSLLQYTYATRGPIAAARAWEITRRTHAAITRSVTVTSHIVPLARLRRKSLELREVTEELARIRTCSGLLDQSDGWQYWPEAVALVRRAS
jgi:hypothetical protein